MLSLQCSYVSVIRSWVRNFPDLQYTFISTAISRVSFVSLANALPLDVLDKGLYKIDDRLTSYATTLLVPENHFY